MQNSKLSTTFSASQVAQLIGIHKDTLLRWLRSGLINEPARDRNGWRKFSSREVEIIKNFAEDSPANEADIQYENHQFNVRNFDLLESMDWDFTGAKTNYLTHGLHPYPAKFIPQIPNALIQELSSIGETVGDIFCGSGTTLVEALTLKRNAVGVDANPLACLITKSKTTLYDVSAIEELKSLKRKCLDFYEYLIKLKTANSSSELIFKSNEWRPSTPKHDFWFEFHVTEELAEILAYSRSLKNNSAKDLALATFSAIIVSVSKQDSDTRYVRREKKNSLGDTVRRFCRMLDQAISSVVEFSDLVEDRFSCELVSESLLTNPVVPSMDLMVCSPPYPNAYSYHLYHRTRMEWLSMNQPKFKSDEMGSHRKYSSKGKNGATVETFRSEFLNILKWLSSNLKKNGYACFVVGNSTLHGKLIDNASLISDIANLAGFSEVSRINRTMQSTKKAFNPTHGKIKTEQILILENKRNI